MSTATRVKTAILGAALSVVAGAASAADTNQPISIATIDSSDADFIAHVYGGLLERYGFNVEYLRIDYTAMIPALETGDLDVSTSIWDTTTWPAVVNAMADHTAVIYGSTGVAVQEGWWYPKYLEEVCPGLPDYKALQSEGCVAALATAETAPRGRYIDAPADWETDSAKRMEALGLDYEVISSGSTVTMIASLRAAVDREEPVFGFGTQPHWYFDQTPGGFVDLPPNLSSCYDDPAAGPNPEATFDCGFSVGFVWKMARNGFAEKSPEAARLLHLFQLEGRDVARATDRIENGGIPIQQVAGEWLDAHQDDWKTWPID
ncbi:MAG: ABC transporter substrate-binding protein [Alphaproteobacteria bacterium]